MTPAARKPAVPYLRAEWRMTERRASGLLGVCRMTVRYEPRRQDDTAIRVRLRELAAVRRRWGYRRLHVLLLREGILVNHKRVYRIYGKKD